MRYDDVMPSNEPPLMEVEVVAPVKLNQKVIDLAETGVVVGQQDGFDIGEVVVGDQTVVFARKETLSAYAVFETRDHQRWMLEMFSVERGSGGMRAVIRYSVKQGRLFVDTQLSRDAIAYLEANIAAGQFAAMIADFRTGTMTSYNPDLTDHRRLPIYDEPFKERQANRDPQQFGWVLTEGLARRGILSPIVLPISRSL